METSFFEPVRTDPVPVLEQAAYFVRAALSPDNRTAMIGPCGSSPFCWFDFTQQEIIWIRSRTCVHAPYGPSSLEERLKNNSAVPWHWWHLGRSNGTQLMSKATRCGR